MCSELSDKALNDMYLGEIFPAAEPLFIKLPLLQAIILVAVAVRSLHFITIISAL
ncbi:MAG: Flagellar biosynthetic protein FliP [Candidatus Midichloria mitochondrii]|uniref:Uncharacterized protein n=1 Tax=Midichloria mitochondrii (strain IricVA) TaxID=696127 RepID=F7XWF8_MIDMI|nr:hypothetical protein midi_00713 [Candidatus Midichloria mitochondrii IricVA]